MIRTFRSKNTEKFFQGNTVTCYPSEILVRASIKLAAIDSAAALNDLALIPGNNLEKLTGDRADQYSIRINQQWRICFTWSEGGADMVEITDYH